jgi:hypothetical protein
MRRSRHPLNNKLEEGLLRFLRGFMPIRRCRQQLRSLTEGPLLAASTFANSRGSSVLLGSHAEMPISPMVLSPHHLRPG